MRKLAIFISIIVLCMCAQAQADTIVLDNGEQIMGVIESETDMDMIVAVEIGKMTLPQSSVADILRASEEENNALLESWRKSKAEIAKTRKYTPRKEEVLESAFRQRGIFSKDPEKNVYITTMRCDDTTIDYTVILPPDYPQIKRMKVIFVFDSQGKGEDAAKRFIPIARINHWIIIAPHGLDGKKKVDYEDILEKLVSDVLKKYKVYRLDFYAAGFGTGTKLAYRMVVKNPRRVRGLIAIGTDFLDHFNYEIRKEVPIYMSASHLDPKKTEARAAAELMGSKDFKVTFRVFGGTYQDVPEWLLKMAVNWFEKNVVLITK